MVDYTEVSGKCDVCHDHPATQWFGDTACATCDDPKCIEWMRQDYARHYQELLDGTYEEIPGDEY